MTEERKGFDAYFRVPQVILEDGTELTLRGNWKFLVDGTAITDDETNDQLVFNLGGGGGLGTNNESDTLVITESPSHDLVVTNVGTLISASSGSTVFLDGLAAPTTGKSHRIAITNDNGDGATLVIQNNAAETASNSFLTPGGVDLVISQGEVYLAVYDQEPSRWRLLKTGSASTVSAGDGVRVTNTGSAYTVHGVRGTCSLEQFGAVGDGTTDDTAALEAAEAAMLAGTYHTLVLGARTYKRTSGSFDLPGGCAIIGQGSGASVLKTTANAPIIAIGGEDWFVTGVTLLGNSTGSSQHGLSDGNTAVAGSGHSRGIFTNSKLLSLGGDGFFYAENPLDGGASTYNGPLVANVLADGCNTGFYTSTRGEYVRFSNCESQRCQIGIRIGAGNVGVVGGSHTANAINIQIDAGANDSHGEFVGVACNHATLKGVVIGAITNGHMFLSCDFFENGGIWLTSSVGVTFVGCRLDAGSYNFDGSTGTLFDACRFSTAYGNTVNDSVSGHASDTRWKDCTGIDGTIPTFVGDRTRLSKTMADANTTLTPQESCAETIIVGGTLTATRTLTWAFAPSKGRKVLVRNGTGQTLNLAWSSGGAVSLATGLGAIIGADGTNATIELTENAGSTGEANTASNQGSGADVFKTKSGVDLQFRSLVAGSGITITQNTNDCTIASSGSGGSSVGSSGQIDIADGTGGWAVATNVLAGNGFVSIGVSPATTGLLRVPLTTQQIIGAGSKSILATSSTALFVGCDSAFSNQIAEVRAYASSLVYLGIGSTTYLGVDGSIGRLFYNVDTQYGAGNMPGTGKLRFLNAAGAIIVQRDSGNTSDMTALYHSASSLYVGATSGGTNRFTNCYIYPATQLGLGVNNTTAIEVDAGYVAFDRPRLGLVSPFGSDGGITVNVSVTSYSVTINEYARSYLSFATVSGAGTNPTVIMPNPGNADQIYYKWVDITGSVDMVTFSVGTGTTKTVSNGTTALLRFTQNAVQRLYEIATSSI